MVRDAFCSFCGAPHARRDGYPRTCPACGVTIWSNPLPVTIALVQVELDGRIGVLVIRRGQEPGRGKLGLVGGFLETGETWAEGAAREVREEAGAAVDPAELAPLWFGSTERRHQVLLFSLAPPRPAAELPPFAPSPECTERGVVFGPDGLDALFAFPLHVEAVRRWRPAGPHDYRRR